MALEFAVVEPPQRVKKKKKKLRFCPWGGRTTPVAHGGVSATPKSQNPSFFIFIYLFFLPWPGGKKNYYF
jgi:hypothetical protein